jgi:hypothetical protein
VRHIVEPRARITLLDEEFERRGEQFGGTCFLAALPDARGQQAPAGWLVTDRSVI